LEIQNKFTSSSIISPIESPVKKMENNVDAETKQNQRLNYRTIRSLLSRTFYLIINLFSVYFFEYVIITSFADVMGQKIKKEYKGTEFENDLAVREFFVILNTCYQLGVFFSRSSLKFVKIKRIWFLTFLQTINFTFLFLNSYYMWIESLYVLCPVLVFVGLMGGGSYVNVLHGILKLDTLD
jgi:battenin